MLKYKKKINCSYCFKKNCSEFQFSNFNENDSRFLDKPKDVYLCKKCSMIFLKQKKDLNKQITKYYSFSNHFLKPGSISEDQKIRRINQVEWALSNILVTEKISSVIDFGSGSGYLLKAFKDKGLKRLLGLDFSKKMCEFAKKKYRIKFLSGDFLKQKISQKYDLATCIQTLEHLINPQKFFIKVKSILNTNGYLFIEVPDSDFPRYDQLPDYYVFDHLFHFTEKNLCNILEDNGFEIISVSHIDNKKDSGNPFRVLRLLAKKNTQFKKRYFINHLDLKILKKTLKEYKLNHSKYLKKFKKKIIKIKKEIKNQKFAIVCGGEHTNLLLKRFKSYINDASLIYDSDEYISGRKLGGILIENSSKIKKDNKIKNFIISSTNHEKELHNHLKKINPKFNVYTVYENYL